MTEKRVLQIGLSYNPGGVESFAINYFRALRPDGYVFDFLSMFDKLAYEDEIRSLGGHVYRVPDVKKNPIAYAEAMRRILRERRYLAVHVNMLSAANVVPLMVAAKEDVPTVIAHSHNSFTPGFVRRALHSFNKPLIPLCSTRMVACSDEAASWLFPRRHAPEAVILKNAINLDNFKNSMERRSEKRAQLGISGSLVVGCVARFEEQKNHEFLIDVFEALCQKNGDAVLLLAGAGELEDQIKRKVACLGLSDKVLFLGIRDDVPDLLCCMDVFLMPSLFEGLSIVLIEAQAAGVYTLTSDRVSPQTRVSNNIAFMSLDGNAEAWAEAIVLQKDLAARNCIEGESVSEVRSNGYDISQEVELLKKLYQGECDQ